MSLGNWKSLFFICTSIVWLAATQVAVAGDGQEADTQATLEPQSLEPLTIVATSGNFVFDVEIADEPAERQVGLMNREKMPPRQGMLFDFNEIRPVAMWMHNTPLSLDMIFIRPDGTIANIAQRTTPYSRQTIESAGPVSHVLEINAGISALIGLKPGDRIQHRFFDDQ